MSSLHSKPSGLAGALRSTAAANASLPYSATGSGVPSSIGSTILGSVTAATAGSHASSSRPIHIVSRPAAKEKSTGSGQVLAHSAPVFRPPPPKAPPARPRLPSLDPPPMELPPSPPVSIPHRLQEEPDNAKKTFEPSSRTNKEVYSRSLSEYNSYLLSASCPPTNDYFSDNFNDQDLKDLNVRTTAAPSTATSAALSEYDDPDLSDVADLPEVGGRLARKQSVETPIAQPLNDPSLSMLSKSPTIFSILSNKPDSVLSSSLPSKGVLSSSLVNRPSGFSFKQPFNNPSAVAHIPSSHSVISHSSSLMHAHAQQATAPKQQKIVTDSNDAANRHDDIDNLADDLQFSISLTDEGSVLDDDENGDGGSSTGDDNVFLPLY